MLKSTTNLKSKTQSESIAGARGTSADTGHRRYGRNRAVQLIIDPGQAGPGSLAGVIKVWLVPLLVEQFFAERRLEVPQPRDRSALAKTVYRTPVQGARAEKRVDTSL
jgi:hypothetical protein